MRYYESPRTIFQKKINDILPKEDSSASLFETIFKLQQIYLFEKNKSAARNNTEESPLWKKLYQLYTELGSVEYAKLITILKGQTITLPTETEYQDSIITALCYYYKEVEGLDWKEIKNKVSIDQPNTIKYGIRVNQLKGFIDEQIFRSIKKVKE